MTISLLVHQEPFEIGTWFLHQQVASKNQNKKRKKKKSREEGKRGGGEEGRED